ncbi:chromate efflux transporter [Paenibacillus sacheonensis]|uniref:Chromate efflux transporter n=1 Tax=Paenibacillus sacheonensis TaxID=742054 RepID=A0A7X5BZP3_9BACL|nr:chromate efflux transporter [Paenibacillus sacheonensis]MBM7567231.1 chromate transporter [Paenibacillus sacheonensis]NBC72873.1 chromate efflux transporter [Paenibacillus sacheonensis]
MNRLLEVLKVSFRLGLTSFGGPIAHLAYFREEYVKRRRWLTEESYADLVALCQFLPGPASSQVGIAIGIGRAGLLGGLLAWVGFTLPSVVLLLAFAYVLQGLDVTDAGWLHGLMIAAVAVVAQAVWGMAAKLANGKATAAIAIASAVAALLVPSPFVQAGIIAASGLLGWRCLRANDAQLSEPLPSTISRRTGAYFLAAFGVLLLALPLLRTAVAGHGLALFDSFYRAGALVFGGGHVVLPLLQQSVVPAGWMTDGQFLAGYGAAQAVPGPLFTLAAYLGFVSGPAPNGIAGGLLAVAAIFLPAFLLVAGALPFWNVIRSKPAFRSALSGINAGVVGILTAALYDPVWTSAIHTGSDFALALIAFGLLVAWKLPPWVVVAVSALGGIALTYI